MVRRIFFLLLISLILGSCSITRVSYFGETPKKAGRFPEFTVKDSLRSKLDRYRACYDVIFYDLDLALEPDRQVIGGTVTMYFRALDTLKTIRFDLRKNLKISKVTFGEAPVDFRRKDLAVYTTLPGAMVPGTIYSIKVKYEGSPARAVKPPWKGGFVWDKDKSGNPWIGVTCETEGSSIWFPCKDHLSDEPDSVRLHMSVPTGLTVVSNGLLEDRKIMNGRETFTWCTHYPVNIYNITFYAGNFVEIADTTLTNGDVLKLDYWVLPEDRNTAAEHFRQVKDVIKVYSNAFGSYPWIKECFKLVESPYEGMEHQTAIAYGNGFQDTQWIGADYIIVHETAHEWWGNAVSVSDFSDIWLQEGFATYSEVIYNEVMKGYDASLDYVYYWLASGIRNKYPVVLPKDVGYWDYRDIDVYSKGALILHTMRNIINDSTVFFDILRTFYKEHAAGKHVTTQDFREVTERITGRSWEKFFDCYLYSRKVPVLKWYFGTWNTEQKGGKGSSISFVAAKWTNVPEGFSMPVTLSCQQSGSSATVDVTTRTRIFYMNKFKSCDRLSCNARHSYFTGITGKDLLEDSDAEVISIKSDEIAASGLR
jgi:aminopeptidase N